MNEGGHSASYVDENVPTLNFLDDDHNTTINAAEDVDQTLNFIKQKDILLNNLNRLEDIKSEGKVASAEQIDDNSSFPPCTNNNNSINIVSSKSETSPPSHLTAKEEEGTILDTCSFQLATSTNSSTISSSIPHLAQKTTNQMLIHRGFIPQQQNSIPSSTTALSSSSVVVGLNPESSKSSITGGSSSSPHIGYIIHDPHLPTSASSSHGDGMTQQSASSIIPIRLSSTSPAAFVGVGGSAAGQQLLTTSNGGRSLPGPTHVQTSVSPVLTDSGDQLNTTPHKLHVKTLTGGGGGTTKQLYPAIVHRTAPLATFVNNNNCKGLLLPLQSSVSSYVQQQKSATGVFHLNNSPNIPSSNPSVVTSFVGVNSTHHHPSNVIMRGSAATFNRYGDNSGGVPPTTPTRTPPTMALQIAPRLRMVQIPLVSAALTPTSTNQSQLIAGGNGGMMTRPILICSGGGITPSMQPNVSKSQIHSTLPTPSHQQLFSVVSNTTSNQNHQQQAPRIFAATPTDINRLIDPRKLVAISALTTPTMTGGVGGSDGLIKRQQSLPPNTSPAAAAILNGRIAASVVVTSSSVPSNSLSTPINLTMCGGGGGDPASQACNTGEGGGRGGIGRGVVECGVMKRYGVGDDGLYASSSCNPVNNDDDNDAFNNMEKQQQQNTGEQQNPINLVVTTTSTVSSPPPSSLSSTTATGTTRRLVVISNPSPTTRDQQESTPSTTSSISDFLLSSPPLPPVDMKDHNGISLSSSSSPSATSINNVTSSSSLSHTTTNIISTSLHSVTPRVFLQQRSAPATLASSNSAYSSLHQQASGSFHNNLHRSATPVYASSLAALGGGGGTSSSSPSTVAAANLVHFTNHPIRMGSSSISSTSKTLQIGVGPTGPPTSISSVLQLPQSPSFNGMLVFRQNEILPSVTHSQQLSCSTPVSSSSMSHQFQSVGGSPLIFAGGGGGLTLPLNNTTPTTASSSSPSPTILSVVPSLNQFASSSYPMVQQQQHQVMVTTSSLHHPPNAGGGSDGVKVTSFSHLHHAMMAAPPQPTRQQAPLMLATTAQKPLPSSIVSNRDGGGGTTTSVDHQKSVVSTPLPQSAAPSTKSSGGRGQKSNSNHTDTMYIQRILEIVALFDHNYYSTKRLAHSSSTTTSSNGKSSSKSSSGGRARKSNSSGKNAVPTSTAATTAQHVSDEVWKGAAKSESRSSTTSTLPGIGQSLTNESFPPSINRTSPPTRQELMAAHSLISGLMMNSPSPAHPLQHGGGRNGLLGERQKEGDEFTSTRDDDQQTPVDMTINLTTSEKGFERRTFDGIDHLRSGVDVKKWDDIDHMNVASASSFLLPKSPNSSHSLSSLPFSIGGGETPPTPSSRNVNKSSEDYTNELNTGSEGNEIKNKPTSSSTIMMNRKSSSESGRGFYNKLLPIVKKKCRKVGQEGKNSKQQEVHSQSPKMKRRKKVTTRSNVSPSKTSVSVDENYSISLSNGINADCDVQPSGTTTTTKKILKRSRKVAKKVMERKRGGVDGTIAATSSYSSPSQNLGDIDEEGRPRHIPHQPQDSQIDEESFIASSLESVGPASAALKKRGGASLFADAEGNDFGIGGGAYDDSVTRCICNYLHDDGYMICCDRCAVWQHVICMGLDKNKIPDEYLCELCDPRMVDRKKARHLQSRRRSQIAAAMAQNQQTVPTTHGSPIHPSSRSIKSEPGGGKRKRRSVSGSGHDIKKVAIRRVGAEENESGSSESDDDEEEQLLKTPPPPTHSSEQMLRCWIDQYEEAVTNHYSPELRSRLASVLPYTSKANSVSGAASGFPSTPGSDMTDCMLKSELRSSTLQAPVKCGVSLQGNGVKHLTSNGAINTGQAVIECKGRFMTSTQYVHANSNTTNQHERRKGGGASTVLESNPFLFLYQVTGRLSVCIDAKTYGNDARFCSRSDEYAKVNCELRHLLDKGSLHIFIVAKKGIAKHEKIVISTSEYSLTDDMIKSCIATSFSSPEKKKREEVVRNLDAVLSSPEKRRSLNHRRTSTSSSSSSSSSSTNTLSSSAPVKFGGGSEMVRRLPDITEEEKEDFQSSFGVDQQSIASEETSSRPSELSRGNRRGRDSISSPPSSPVVPSHFSPHVDNVVSTKSVITSSPTFSPPLSSPPTSRLSSVGGGGGSSIPSRHNSLLGLPDNKGLIVGVNTINYDAASDLKNKSQSREQRKMEMIMKAFEAMERKKTPSGSSGGTGGGGLSSSSSVSTSYSKRLSSPHVVGGGGGGDDNCDIFNDTPFQRPTTLNLTTSGHRRSSVSDRTGLSRGGVANFGTVNSRSNIASSSKNRKRRSSHVVRQNEGEDDQENDGDAAEEEKQQIRKGGVVGGRLSGGAALMARAAKRREELRQQAAERDLKDASLERSYSYPSYSSVVPNNGTTSDMSKLSLTNVNGDLSNMTPANINELFFTSDEDDQDQSQNRREEGVGGENSETGGLISEEDSIRHHAPMKKQLMTQWLASSSSYEERNSTSTTNTNLISPPPPDQSPVNHHEEEQHQQLPPSNLKKRWMKLAANVMTSGAVEQTPASTVIVPPPHPPVVPMANDGSPSTEEQNTVTVSADDVFVKEEEDQNSVESDGLMFEKKKVAEEECGIVSKGMNTSDQFPMVGNDVEDKNLDRHESTLTTTTSCNSNLFKSFFTATDLSIQKLEEELEKQSKIRQNLLNDLASSSTQLDSLEVKTTIAVDGGGIEKNEADATAKGPTTSPSTRENEAGDYDQKKNDEVFGDIVAPPSQASTADVEVKKSEVKSESPIPCSTGSKRESVKEQYEEEGLKQSPVKSFENDLVLDFSSIKEENKYVLSPPPVEVGEQTPDLPPSKRDDARESSREERGVNRSSVEAVESASSIDGRHQGSEDGGVAADTGLGTTLSVTAPPPPAAGVVSEKRRVVSLADYKKRRRLQEEQKQLEMPNRFDDQAKLSPAAANVDFMASNVSENEKQATHPNEQMTTEELAINHKELFVKEEESKSLKIPEPLFEKLTLKRGLTPFVKTVASVQTEEEGGVSHPTDDHAVKDIASNVDDSQSIFCQKAASLVEDENDFIRVKRAKLIESGFEVSGTEAFDLGSTADLGLPVIEENSSVISSLPALLAPPFPQSVSNRRHEKVDLKQNDVDQEKQDKRSDCQSPSRKEGVRRPLSTSPSKVTPRREEDSEIKNSFSSRRLPREHSVSSSSSMKKSRVSPVVTRKAIAEEDDLIPPLVRRHGDLTERLQREFGLDNIVLTSSEGKQNQQSSRTSDLSVKQVDRKNSAPKRSDSSVHSSSTKQKHSSSLRHSSSPSSHLRMVGSKLPPSSSSSSKMVIPPYPTGSTVKRSSSSLGPPPPAVPVKERVSCGGEKPSNTARSTDESGNNHSRSTDNYNNRHRSGSSRSSVGLVSSYESDGRGRIYSSSSSSSRTYHGDQYHHRNYSSSSSKSSSHSTSRNLDHRHHRSPVSAHSGRYGSNSTTTNAVGSATFGGGGGRSTMMMSPPPPPLGEGGVHNNASSCRRSSSTSHSTVGGSGGGGNNGGSTSSKFYASSSSSRW